MPFPIGSKCLHINKEKAQTFAIRRTVHHKPHRNMGNLRPKRGSSNILCSLAASTVVIVRLSSKYVCILCGMLCKYTRIY